MGVLYISLLQGHVLSVLSLQLEIESLASLNLIRLERQLRKLTPKILFLQNYLWYQNLSVLVWVFQRTEPERKRDRERERQRERERFTVKNWHMQPWSLISLRSVVS